MENGRYCRTDLAVEWQQKDKGAGLPGVCFHERREMDFRVYEMVIESQEGAAAVGRPEGLYLTFDLGRPWLLSDKRREEARTLLARHIRRLCRAQWRSHGEDCLFVVGLGNREMTCDAIGPMTVERITVTRHVKRLDPALFERLSHRSVAAICPGVLGQTGLESAVTVKAVAETLEPGLILVVDALAAKSSDRLACTVQLSTGGIAPGSGVGNDRPAFTRESMGVPVLAIGVPMVVDSSTLVADALERAGIDELPKALLPVLENGRSFFVSLKEADAAAEAMASLLAEAIDEAMSR